MEIGYVETRVREEIGRMWDFHPHPAEVRMIAAGF